MYNKVILIGRVGKDADVKTFENGDKVANFSLATSQRGYKKADGTEVAERTEWHNITVRGKNAVDFTEKWVKKGSGVKIEGEIRYRKYDKDGETRYITEIFTNDVQFFSFGTKPNSENTTAQTQPDASATMPDEIPAGVTSKDDLPF